MNTENLKDQITEGLKNFIKENRKGGNANRASSASRCVRANWYKNNNYEEVPLNPRALLVFAFGDLTEMLVSFLASHAVGPNKYYKQLQFGIDKRGSVLIQNGAMSLTQWTQFEWTTWIESLAIPGHPDGIGQRQDGAWELIEIKSSATRGFMRAQQVGVGDYINQAYTLMASEEAKKLEIRDVRFFYINKDTQDWDTFFYTWDQTTWERVVNNFKLANLPIIPERPYKPEQEFFRKKPTGKAKLPWQCSYCGYNKECWPEAKLDFKSNKPVYYIEETISETK